MSRLLRRLSNIQWFIIDYPKRYAGPQHGTVADQRRQTYDAIGNGTNDFLIVVVAGAGFFTDSYLLFASNVVLPMLGFVYWNGDVQSDHETAINSATLAGCIVGQIIFGALADHWGRRKMYGFELIILAVGTFGFVMASTGYNGSMNIVSWLIFWRFISGIGIGADYPLSAVITSEFAPKEKRARLLATVFFMQAMGQLCATLVSLAVVAGYRNDSLSHAGDEAKATIDSVWRWVMGAGLLPTLVAIIARFKIPESPRYTMDVLGNTFKASVDARDYRGQARDEQELQPMMNGNANADEANPGANGAAAHGNNHLNVPAVPNGPGAAPAYPKASYADAVEYFVTQGNWVYLLGTTVSWFVLDFAFYGLGMNSPSTIAKIWDIAPPNSSAPTRWSTEYDPTLSVFQDLLRSGAHALVVVSLGAVVGGLLLILFINHLNRKRLQWGGFLALFVIFIILGASFKSIVQTSFHGVAITLYVLSQIAFNFGPNSLTFIIPAELFPTRYRASCHGISAAAGKFGSVIVQLFLAYVKFDSKGNNDPRSLWLGDVLIILSAFMLIGALVTILCIPEVQSSSLHSPPNSPYSLETTAVGRARANGSTDDHEPGAPILARPRGQIRLLPLLNDDDDEDYGDQKFLRRVWRCVRWSRN